MQSRKTNSLKNVQWDKYMVYIIFIVVFALFAIALGDKGFLNKNNILNILRQTSMISVMAVAGVFCYGGCSDRSDSRLGGSHERNDRLDDSAFDKFNSAGACYGSCFRLCDWHDKRPAGYQTWASVFPCNPWHYADGPWWSDVDYGYGCGSN